MPDSPSHLRAQIRDLQTRRRSLESKLLQPQSMLAASLIERFLSSRGSPRASRASPAYYLSRSAQGRSRLTYIPKEQLSATRQQCEGYRRYRQNLAAWRQLTAELAALWKRLQQAQSQ